MTSRTAVILLSAAFPAAAGLEASVEFFASNLSPVEPAYDSRFLTPGSSWGIGLELDAPGPVCFDLMFERFGKEAAAATDWDGEVSASLASAFPTARLGVSGVDLLAGPLVVYADGEYSGTDDFGRFVEVSGSSLGFGFGAGLSIEIWGPLDAGLEYRRLFMDLKTDWADIDGDRTRIYPAAETDLGYGQFGVVLGVSVTGAESSLLSLL